MTKLLVIGTGHPLAAGTMELEVEAGTFRQLIAELDRLYPGLGTHVENEMAVSIDGVVWQDTYDAPIGSGTEVVLFPKIKGG
jgi:molybdopterin converting factor small subunit